jgi:hypothetical protein
MKQILKCLLLVVVVFLRPVLWLPRKPRTNPRRKNCFSEEIPEGEQTKDVGARAGAVRSLEDRLVKLEGAVSIGT